jgi:hypothetical protein
MLVSARCAVRVRRAPCALLRCDSPGGALRPGTPARDRLERRQQVASIERFLQEPEHGADSVRVERLDRAQARHTMNDDSLSTEYEPASPPVEDGGEGRQELNRSGLNRHA